MDGYQREQNIGECLVHVLHPMTTDVVVGRVTTDTGEKAQRQQSVDRPTACRVVTHEMLGQAREERFDVDQYSKWTVSKRSEARIARAHEPPHQTEHHEREHGVAKDDMDVAVSLG